MKLPSVRWAAKPMTRPIDGGGGEDPAGDRPHLRDHEQRREDPDATIAAITLRRRTR